MDADVNLSGIPVTPRVTRYDCDAAIPPRFGAQIRSLLRAAGWLGAGEADAARPLTDPRLRPAYFLLAGGDRVHSYARTIRATVSHLGRSFNFYGLGDVITRPGFRRRGHGGRVVEEATAHIKSDVEADAAVLLTGRTLEAFYRQRGWEYVRGLRVTTGEGGACPADAIIPMMLFVSARARAARRRFTVETLVLPGDEW